MVGTMAFPLLVFSNCKWLHPSHPLFSVCLIGKRAGPAPPEGSGTPTKTASPGLCLQEANSLQPFQEGTEQECSENGIPVWGTQETTQNVGNLSCAEHYRRFPISLRACAFPIPQQTGLIENTEYNNTATMCVKGSCRLPVLGVMVP